MAIQRYVNLNKTPVHIPGPKGGQVIVHPYREALDPRSRRADAIYVLEGDFWARFAGTAAGPLHRHPSVPKAYGLDSFPDLPVHHFDGRADDGQMLTSGEPRSQVAAQALPGRFRLAGDVITPQGMIRRRNPDTGEDEEVPDIPENRNVLPPLNPVGPEPKMLHKSITDYLAEKGVTTAIELAQLTDEQLLQIPGMHPNAIGRLRENITLLFREEEERAARTAPAPEPDNTYGQVAPLNVPSSESEETPDESGEELAPPPPTLRQRARDTVSSGSPAKKAAKRKRKG